MFASTIQALLNIHLQQGMVKAGNNISSCAADGADCGLVCDQVKVQYICHNTKVLQIAASKSLSEGLLLSSWRQAASRAISKI